MAISKPSASAHPDAAPQAPLSAKPGTHASPRLVANRNCRRARSSSAGCARHRRGTRGAGYGRLAEVDDLVGGVVVEVTHQRRPDAVSEREYDTFPRRKEYPQDIENTSQKMRHSIKACDLASCRIRDSFRKLLNNIHNTEFHRLHSAAPIPLETLHCPGRVLCILGTGLYTGPGTRARTHTGAEGRVHARVIARHRGPS